MGKDRKGEEIEIVPRLIECALIRPDKSPRKPFPSETPTTLTFYPQQKKNKTKKNKNQFDIIKRALSHD